MHGGCTHGNVPISIRIEYLFNIWLHGCKGLKGGRPAGGGVLGPGPAWVGRATAGCRPRSHPCPQQFCPNSPTLRLLTARLLFLHPCAAQALGAGGNRGGQRGGAVPQPPHLCATQTLSPRSHVPPPQPGALRLPAACWLWLASSSRRGGGEPAAAGSGFHGRGCCRRTQPCCGASPTHCADFGSTPDWSRQRTSLLQMGDGRVCALTCPPCAPSRCPPSCLPAAARGGGGGAAGGAAAAAPAAPARPRGGARSAAAAGGREPAVMSRRQAGVPTTAAFRRRFSSS